MWEGERERAPKTKLILKYKKIFKIYSNIQSKITLYIAFQVF